jgi:uncharacterized protein YbdZ (MbtH family)
MDPLHAVVAEEGNDRLMWPAALPVPEGWQWERLGSARGSTAAIRRVSPGSGLPEAARSAQQPE